MPGLNLLQSKRNSYKKCPFLQLNSECAKELKPLLQYKYQLPDKVLSQYTVNRTSGKCMTEKRMSAADLYEQKLDLYIKSNRVK